MSVESRGDGHLPRLDEGGRYAHINAMPHKGSSPRTLDLFEYTVTVPTPRSEPAPASGELPELAGLSEAQLVGRLPSDLV